MRETSIEQRLKQKVESAGGLCLKLTSPGANGMPDRIICFKGRVIFVETKTPIGRLSAIQRYQIKKLRRRDMDVRVIWNEKQVDLFVEELNGIQTPQLSAES